MKKIFIKKNFIEINNNIDLFNNSIKTLNILQKKKRKEFLMNL